MTPVALLLGLAAWAGDERPARTDRVFSEYTAPGSPGCAVGVLENGAARWRKGYGLADVEHRVPLVPESRFYLASVSKQFTAMAAIVAAREGKLSLDDPLSKHVPEMPAYAARIPLRRLLDHTAGLRDYLTLWDLKGWSNNSALQPGATLALIARQQAVDFEPGTDFSYSNTGYFLMSVILERATGRKLGDYLEEKVFRPLGMTATRVQHDHTVPVPHRAHGYSRGRVLDVNFDVTGSGGVYSNVDDLLKWARHLLETAPVLAALSTPGKLRDGRETPTGYALGLRRTRLGEALEISHGGSAPGYRTYFALYPERRLAVVVLCNGDGNSQTLAQKTAGVWMGIDVAPAEAARPEPLTEAPVPAALLGAWWSPELESVWRFERRGDAVVLETDGPPRTVKATADGKLRAGGATIELAETSLLVSAGRARGIRFTRYRP